MIWASDGLSSNVKPFENLLLWEWYTCPDSWSRLRGRHVAKPRCRHERHICSQDTRSACSQLTRSAQANLWGPKTFRIIKKSEKWMFLNGFSFKTIKKFKKLMFSNGFSFKHIKQVQKVKVFKWFELQMCCHPTSSHLKTHYFENGTLAQTRGQGYEVR